MKDRQLKYVWARTWDRRPNDYVAYDGAISFGRVQLHTSGPEKVWTWHLWGDAIKGMPASRNGSHVDKVEACRELEAAYDAERGDPLKRKKAPLAG